MAVIHTPVPNLISGVSQQPDFLRLVSQAETQVNAFPSVVEGLIKRHPTEHVAQLMSGTIPDMALHTINRDSTERYAVTMHTDAVRVFDVTDGSELTVVQGVSENLLSSESVFSASDWTATGTSTRVDGATDPEGGTTADVFDDTDGAVASEIYQDVVAEKLTDGARYLFRLRAKENTIGANFRLVVEESGGGNTYDIEVDLTAGTIDTAATEALEATITRLSDDDATKPWYLIQGEFIYDASHGTGGVRYRIIADTVAANTGSIDIWKAELAFEPLDYLSLRTPNLLEDPEEFISTAEEGPWTITPDADESLDAGEVGPLGFGDARILRCGAGGAALAGYSQTVGVLYDGPQTLSVYVKAPATDIGTLQLNIRDSGGSAQSYTGNFIFTAGVLSVDSSHAAVTAAVVQVGDTAAEWYRASITFDPNHASSTSVPGDVREFFVTENDCDPGDNRDIYAWGALAEEGVSTPGAYLHDADFLKALTVADFTFITNSKKVTAMSAEQTASKSDESDVTDDEAFVFVRQGADESHYEVRIDVGAGLNTATYDSGGTNGFQTDEDIAESLKTSIDAFGSITATRVGSVIRITTSGSTTIDVLETSDSLGDTGLVSVHDEIELFTDLPLTCRNGYRIKITGQPEAGGDDYYVKFVANEGGSTFGPGRWEETVAYDVDFKFDASTLPHQLVRKQDDTSGSVTGSPLSVYFEFSPVLWNDREKGDAETNPEPSFMSTATANRTINDVFFFKNRLGFLSDQNVILSEVGVYFNFWRTTVITLVDSDPIDASAAHTKVSILNHAIPLDEQLVLFSAETQFVVTGVPVLTPSTIEITPVLEFENFTLPSPVSSGRGVFFPYKRGTFSGMREMFPGGDVAFDTDDLTAHVPKYIEGEVRKIASSTLEDVLVVLGDGDLTEAYVYKFFWNGAQKLQSAWSTYEFGSATILNVDFIENTLYVVLQRDEGVMLEKMTISSGIVDPTSELQIRLDRRIDDTHSGVTPTYDMVNDETEFTLPYDIDSGSTLQVVTRKSGSQDEGQLLQTQSTNTVTPGSHTITVLGDHTATPVYIGESYTMTYTFTKPTLRANASTGGQTIIAQGRFSIRYGTIVYSDSAFFRVKVTPKLRDEQSYEFTGQMLDEGPVLDEVGLDTGKFRFPVVTLGDDVVIVVENDSPLPSNLLSAEWESQYYTRGRRFGA